MNVNIKFSDNRVKLDELKHDLEQSTLEDEDEDLFLYHVEEQVDQALETIFGE